LVRISFPGSHFRTFRRAATLCVLALAMALQSCAYVEDLFRQKPQPLLPAQDLYQLGDAEMVKKNYPLARGYYQKIVERHPQSSYAPRARFLVGETYYREGNFDKAIPEFEGFLAFFPRHEIGDLAQFRLAMSYYDQLKPVEQDQALTVKAMDQLKKLVREYPESRYASDALAKIEICRGRLAQKELWVATYYFDIENNPAAARQRLEGVLKDYPRTLIIPEAMYRLADLNAREGRAAEAQAMFRKLADDYSYTEWGKRATQRLRTAATR
jgi:outer membrane protein assembly factor BamD